jgi:hypothetical protein
MPPDISYTVYPALSDNSYIVYQYRFQQRRISTPSDICDILYPILSDISHTVHPTLSEISYIVYSIASSAST